MVVSSEELRKVLKFGAVLVRAPLALREGRGGEGLLLPLPSAIGT